MPPIRYGFNRIFWDAVNHGPSVVADSIPTRTDAVSDELRYPDAS
jgi:hypothetical protein